MSQTFSQLKFSPVSRRLFFHCVLKVFWSFFHCVLFFWLAREILPFRIAGIFLEPFPHVDENRAVSCERLL